MQITNPATEEVIRELKEDTREMIQAKCEALQQYLPTWQSVALEEKVEIIKGFARSLNANIEDLAAVLTNEMGKPLQQSRNEINGAINRINWMTSNAEKCFSDEVMTLEPGLEERIIYEPLGTICNISAWNYPYLVGVNVFIPALLAGNAVLYKPSEHTILTGMEIENLLKVAGIPEDAFHIAKGGGKVGEQLLKLPLDGYFFTGSYKTGKYIYERVAEKMVPCSLEMGGKDPLYISDNNKNLKAVAEAAADGAFYNNGQSCCAVERIYVHEKVYEEFVYEFVKVVNSWVVGLPTDDGVYFGPLSRKEQIGVLEKQIVDALRKGASLMAGGRRMKRTGYFFEPTILTKVTHKMKVMNEETFGPLIGIMKVSNASEVVNLMNDTSFGLTAGVFSASREEATTLLSQVNTGTGYWNCCDRVSAPLPWSGRKHSGIGSTLSFAGMRAFVKPKALHLKS